MTEYVIANKSDITNIADILRAKIGKSDKLSLSEIGTEIENYNGNTGIEDDFINRTLSGYYENDRVTKIGQYVFAYCNNLTSVNFPNCTTID